MRGGILASGVLAGVLLIGPAHAGMADRLVTACEIALNAHARDLVLDFGHSTRVGREVKVAFSFEQSGKRHDAEARCAFRETLPVEALAPPSLESFDVMGRSSPSMFLKSHHAIWEHFSPEEPERSRPAPAETLEDAEPPVRPARRPLIG